MCRKPLDVSHFSVSITITNNFNGLISNSNINPELLDNIFDIFEIGLEFESRVDIETLFSDIGAILSNDHAFVLNTE